MICIEHRMFFTNSMCYNVLIQLAMPRINYFDICVTINSPCICIVGFLSNPPDIEKQGYSKYYNWPPPHIITCHVTFRTDQICLPHCLRHYRYILRGLFFLAALGWKRNGMKWWLFKTISRLYQVVALAVSWMNTQGINDSTHPPYSKSVRVNGMQGN